MRGGFDTRSQLERYRTGGRRPLLTVSRENYCARTPPQTISGAALNSHFAGWLAYQLARLSMMALLYGKLILCMVELSRLSSRYARSAMIR